MNFPLEQATFSLTAESEPVDFVTTKLMAMSSAPPPACLPASSANTVMIDLRVDRPRDGDRLLEVVEETLVQHLPEGLAPVVKAKGVALLQGGGLTALLKHYEDGLITITLEYYKEHRDMENLITVEATRALEATLYKTINASKGLAYPLIKRGVFGRYFTTSDERLLEYDVDSVVFEKTSPFQKIQIVHSKSLGNILILDELQNISEADLIYTETLMQRGKENYEGAEIIILGGGDGALLYELLKEKPKFVWMLEIDEDVMVACNKYMKSICGSVLETRKAIDYEIIVDDCMVTLDQFLAQGKKVDYIFGDLTDIPISDKPTGEIWDFIMLILSTSFKLLKPTGKFMTHANGASSPESLKMYENQLKKLESPVDFTKATAFIPSFLEDWVFYQIFFKNEKNGTA